MAFTKTRFASVRTLCAKALTRPKTVASAALMSTLLLAAGGAQAASAYENPFAGDHVSVGRTDMGVDVCLSPGEPIRAIGDGVVVGILPNWYQGQPYIWYKLTSGADAGKYVYVAEQITGLAAVGHTLRAGDVVARFASKGTCIEIGWSAADGWTLAQVTTGYKEGQRTAAGISFANFLTSLGVHNGLQPAPAPTGSGQATTTKPVTKPAPKPPTTTPAPKPPTTTTPTPKPPTTTPAPPSTGTTTGSTGQDNGSDDSHDHDTSHRHHRHHHS